MVVWSPPTSIADACELAEKARADGWMVQCLWWGGGVSCCVWRKADEWSASNHPPEQMARAITTAILEAFGLL